MTDVIPTTTPDEVQDRRVRLYDATRFLQRSLRAPVHDATTWRDGLGEAVETVGDVVTAHVTETEEPVGFFDQLVDESDGRLASSVERLRDEHRRSLEMVMDLRRSIEGHDDPEALRMAAAALFDLLDAHRHHGSDLLWQAYGQDIGVGD